MQVRRHYEDVEGAYAIRNPEPKVANYGPDPSAEEKKKEIADKFTIVTEEKPRRRVRAL
jgi:hypothetical protein